MGKKQKKKAAIAAAAKRAQSQSAPPAGDASISNKNDCDDVVGDDASDNSTTVDDLMPKKNHDIRSICNNMQSLLSLARNLKTQTDGNSKSQPSSESASTSEVADSDDEEDAVLIEETGAVGGAVQPKPKLTSDSVTQFGMVPKFSRGEKKARRLLMKLDLQPVKNVSRVTMRKAKNVMLYIDHPEVFKCPNTMTLICFGEVRVENTSNTATVQAAERYINDVNALSPYEENDDKEPGVAGNDEEEFDIDELGSMLDDKDIELVQMQATCSRQSAIKALIKHNSDVVNAIMDLTV